MASIFTKIINGDIPCYKIAENQNCIAFLDINPLTKGHCLVVPKKEIDYIFDLDEKYLANLHKFAQKIAKAIDKTIECKRVGIAVVGLEIAHAHIHLIPINNIEDINFARPKLKLDKQEFTKIAQKIKLNLEK